MEGDVEEVSVLAKNRRFLAEIEQAIPITNNEIIHAQVPRINAERMISFATAIATLRAKYIQAAFNFADVKLADGEESTSEIDALNVYRSQFETVREAFIALQRAIELGYVVVE